jgi:5-methylcytosine-specific restriction endonuclease McrA
VRAMQQRRRALRNGAPRSDLTAAQWTAIKAHYSYRCVYCGTKPKRLTQDHVTPLSKGGSHTVSNIVPACRSCNSRKGTGGPIVPIQPLLLSI